MPRLLLLAVVVPLLVAATLASAPRRAAAATPVSFHDGHGLTVVSVAHPAPRQWRLVVSTAQLARPVRVSVLLPAGYSTGTRRYPTLYLFHGTSGGANDWLSSGRVAATTARAPLIVVMPDAGYDSNGGSFFTDWVDQKTALGTANWASFHINQLIPWIDANLRTVATRSGRAIAGLSQGGLGSFSYASRHPDLFASAASFSGAPDIFHDPAAKAAGTAVVSAIATGLDGVQPNAMFGDPVTNSINWQGHDPADLVTNLRGMNLALWAGNGLPGPLDTPSPTTPAGAAIEAVTHASTLFFAQAAQAANVRYYLDDYGAGTHSWPYWARDLTQYLPRLLHVFAHPTPAPSVIGYRSIDRTWTQWGWRVANKRSALQAWSELDNAARTGFRYTGADSATVTTAPFYRAGATYRVTMTGAAARLIRAGAGGRLTVPVATAGGASTTVTITAEA